MSAGWPSTSDGWRRYFDEHEQLAVADVGVVRLTDSGAARALVRSLRRFQAGESSGRRLADEAQRGDLPYLDDDLRWSIVRFMAEEERHGELLAALLGRLGSNPPVSDLSTIAFTKLRRAFGFRAKFAVIVVAEIVGIAFYDTVATTVDEPTVRQVMASIRDDEIAHLAFGADLLGRMIDAPGPAFLRRWRRIALVSWIRLVLTLAVVGLSLDHLPLMRRIGLRTVLGHARRSHRALVDELVPLVRRPLAVAVPDAPAMGARPAA